jgi:chromosome partitioning protein
VLIFKGSADLHRVVVLNPKGGSGKTTLAFNLAGYLAATGRKVAIVDMDRQGSSTHWLQNRSSDLPEIVGISVRDSEHDATGNQCIAVPEEIEYAVIDAPAGLPGDRLIDYTCGAHAIFVPVLPSDLDIHAASRLISDLLLKAQVSRRNERLGVIANRVKERTIAYQQLRRFLSRLSITVVGLIRDSQNYARAAENGRCIHEMPPSRVRKDLAQWEAISLWLESRLTMPLTPRDLLRPVAPAVPRRRKRLGSAVLIATAAAVAMFGVSLWLWSAMRSPHEMQTVSQGATINIEPAALTEVVVAELPEKLVVVSAGKKLKDKWQLSGVAHRGGSSVLILRDRVENTSRRISDDVDLDGWIVRDFGPDYAVFAQNGEEVRLVLNEDIEY